MNVKQMSREKSWARREAKWKREGRKREKQRRNSEDDLQPSSDADPSGNQHKSYHLHSSQIRTTSEAAVEGLDGHDLPPTFGESSSSSDSSTSSSSSSSSSSSESDKEPTRKADSSAKSKAESSVNSLRDETNTSAKQEGKLAKSFEIDFGDGFASGTDSGPFLNEEGYLDRSKGHDSTEKVLPMDSDFDLDDLDDNDDQLVDRKGHRRRRRRKYQDDKAPFVLEIDDETDEDFLSVLLDKNLPEGIRMCTSQTMPEFSTGLRSKPRYTDGQMVMSMLRFQWNSSAFRGTRSNQFFSSLFQELFAKLCSQLDGCSPAIVCGVRTQVNLTPDDMIELICTGKVIAENISPRFEERLDSDSTLFKELELRKKEDLEQRELSKEIEKGALLLSSTAPSISQNRATVIVDILSDDMKQLHRSQAHQESHVIQSSRSSTASVSSLLVTPTLSTEASFNEPFSPTGAETERVPPLPPRSPKSPRAKSEGRARGVPSSPATALALIRSVPISHFAPSLKQPSPPKVAVANAIAEMPVELTPLNYISDASVSGRLDAVGWIISLFSLSFSCKGCGIYWHSLYALCA